MISEFVAKKLNSKTRKHDVAKVEISTKLHCSCGKTSEVELEVDYERGWYDDVDMFMEVECPICGKKYENAIY